MRHRVRASLVLGALAALAACVTTERAPFTAVGRGDRLLADSICMTGNEALWGRGMQAAAFREGAVFEGVQCIEVAIPFGETAVGWTFTGVPVGRPIEVVFDANVDFFNTQTYLYVACLPGIRTAADMREPRDEFRSFQRLGWADGSARWPDSTEGWQTFRFAGPPADAQGAVTVMMIFGHPREDPPVVSAAITNPAVSAVEGQQ